MAFIQINEVVMVFHKASIALGEAARTITAF